MLRKALDARGFGRVKLAVRTPPSRHACV